MLDSKLVDTLFARLVLAYGTHFTAQYEGMNRGAVKRDWADRLASFQRRGAEGELIAPAIDWALTNLPERPPNAIEFRTLCRSYTPPAAAPALPSPPRPVPPKFMAAVARLTGPIQDDRPEPVRIASRYVAKFGAPGQKLTPFHKNNLDHFRRVLEDYEAELERAAERKADAEVQ